MYRSRSRCSFRFPNRRRSLFRPGHRDGAGGSHSGLAPMARPRWLPRFLGPEPRLDAGTKRREVPLAEYAALSELARSPLRMWLLGLEQSAALPDESPLRRQG